MPAAWREDSFLYELDIHIKTNAFTLVSCIACISSSQYVPNLYLFLFWGQKVHHLYHLKQEQQKLEEPKTREPYRTDLPTPISRNISSWIAVVAATASCVM